MRMRRLAHLLVITTLLAGVFPFHCYVPHDPATGQCSPDHDTQVGYLVVLDTPR